VILIINHSYIATKPGITPSTTRSTYKKKKHANHGREDHFCCDQKNNTISVTPITTTTKLIF
jgi:hypothetical protein